MIPLYVESSYGPVLQLAVIILATFASEDLTCIAVGLLIGSNQLDAVVGLSGCFLGIFVGDLGLWLIGYLAGLGLLQLSLVGRVLPLQRREGLRRWLDERGATALVAARFLPGARLPLYLGSGLLGLSLRRFAYWTFLAALLWTPLLVILAALLGAPIVQPAIVLLGPGWPALLLAALTLFLTVRVCTLACTATGRSKLVARVSRLWRWEFWPSWLFYLPVLPWLAYLSVRYRGVLTWTAANPGIPQGGVVGESKYAILVQLPQSSVVPTILVPPGEPGARLAQVRQAIEAPGWSFPLILKPDAAQRGAGVRRVRDLVDVEKYLRGQPGAVLVQTYHPGPFEAGIFYYRLPGEANGHIFSITDKVFPVLVGDGRSTLEELIWRDPRYRMQARTFLARHDAERGRVLAAGERSALALAGNHCQGTMFRDGAHLVTPELERAVDAIARQFPGFYIGRFDVRYTDPEAFRAGRDLGIVELNGATSESTNLYDPSWSLFAAYRTLFRQWSLLYRIGDANWQRGHAPTGILELLRLVFGYYRGVRVDPLAD
jgi:membrane protein DedA with SNARE-associated domain